MNKDQYSISNDKCSIFSILVVVRVIIFDSNIKITGPIIVHGVRFVNLNFLTTVSRDYTFNLLKTSNLTNQIKKKTKSSGKNKTLQMFVCSIPSGEDK